jgi:hypothetical protein
MSQISPDPTFTFAILAAIWLLILATGRYQLKKVKENTVELILTEAKRQIKGNKSISMQTFYKKIYPSWCQMLKSTAWFIPHKTELWPMPASPDYVKDRIKFLPDVVGQFLSDNGYKVAGLVTEQEIIEVLE